MSIRITQSMLSRSLLADLAATTGRLARIQDKLSSGKELQRPSDDPFGASRALQLRAGLAENRQHQRNATEAAAWQTVADTALSQVGDLTLRARELLLRGANGTLGTVARQSIAVEIDQLAEAVKAEANAEYGGRYVFAGSATLTRPYAAGLSDAYAGNTQTIVREIGPGITLDVNQAGSAVVGDGSTGLLKALRDIAAHLRADDVTALQGPDLQAIDAAHDMLTNARAVVGARTNRLETAIARLGAIEESSQLLLSETEDADMAKVLIDFSTQQAVYQSALKAGAQIIQPSLMDFLR